MKIWVDADACPKVIKETVYKISSRLKIPVCLVANSSMQYPLDPLVSFVLVEQGADVADLYIANEVQINEVVITADIPLANLVVKKGAIAVDPRGELYTEESIGDRLATRDLMKDLRNEGLITGGPAAFNAKDKENFTNSLNRILTKLMKRP